MSACGCEVDANPDAAQRRVLRWALSLNAIMFGIGFVAGIAAESTGLLADSLDMLADASAYGIGLAALGRSAFFKARAASLSGSLLLILGAGVLVDVLRRGVAGAHPESTIMLAVATLSLLVNATVLILLRPYRAGEVHLRATWIFTRVDVVANLAVIAAALVVRWTARDWMDLVVGGLIGIYVMKEAFEILASARRAAASAAVG
ncbi:MAG: cation transporter [Chthoniobacterales bacterium]